MHRANKILSLSFIILLLLSLVSCIGDSAQATDTTDAEVTNTETTDELMETESTAEEVSVGEIMTEELTVIPETTAMETAEATTAEVTTEEVTTEEPNNILADPTDIAFAFTQKKVCTNKITERLYKDYFKRASDTGIVIPALEEHFVPQGMTYWEEMNWFIISGYFNPTDYSATSALVCVDATTGKYVGEYTVCDVSGIPCEGHFGGVAVAGDSLYLTGSYMLFRIPLSALKQAGNKGVLMAVELISLPVSAAFCNYSNGILWVGEFYESKSYPLKNEHVYTNNDGTTYYAWAIGYKLKPSKRGLEDSPSYVLSLPEKIQGFSVAEDGRIFMTQSYGRKNDSTFFICESPFEKTPARIVIIDGVEVPMWYLDRANGYETVTALPMAEGCCAIGNDVYVIFESGAYYYRAYSSSVSANPTDTVWKYTLP